MSALDEPIVLVPETDPKRIARGRELLREMFGVELPLQDAEIAAGKASTPKSA